MPADTIKLGPSCSDRNALAELGHRRQATRSPVKHAPGKRRPDAGQIDRRTYRRLERGRHDADDDEIQTAAAGNGDPKLLPDDVVSTRELGGPHVVPDHRDGWSVRVIVPRFQTAASDRMDRKQGKEI